MYILLGIATLNLVLSLYNYLRIVRAIAISQPGEETVPTVKGSLATNAVLIICVIALIGLGFVGSLYGFIDKISSAL